MSQQKVNSTKFSNPQKLLEDDLIRACRQGDIIEVKKALKEGANVNIIDQEGYTPLHYAARFGRAYIVRLLLDQKADIKRQDGGGNTAGDLAFKNNYPEIVQLIKRYD